MTISHLPAQVHSTFSGLGAAPVQAEAVAVLVLVQQLTLNLQLLAEDADATKLLLPRVLHARQMLCDVTRFAQLRLEVQRSLRGLGTLSVDATIRPFNDPNFQLSQNKSAVARRTRQK